MEFILSSSTHVTFWLDQILCALVFGYLISGVVSNLRRNVGRRWVLISGLTIFYLIFFGLAIVLGRLSYSIDQMYNSMRLPMEVTQVSKDWGKNMSIEDRNKTSQNLARIAFVSGGIIRNYIDVNGNLSTYMPNDEDRKNRALFINSLDQTHKAATLYFYLCIGWLFVALLSTGIGFTSLGQRIGRSLAKRYPPTKADDLPIA